MHVVATAGHVDHGKSALVRALTGMEPDRWAEERRRGMTIDLGFAWTTLPTGDEIAFVDVPGHERFVPNMLAGVGPVPAALLVVAADEGWRRQTDEHVAALDALGVRHGLLVITRADLSGAGRRAEVEVDAIERLATTSLADIESVVVSAVTGEGLEALRAALVRLVRALPTPDPAAPVRLWVDRSFTVAGAGTVVTGTLTGGTLGPGDELESTPADGRLRVRGVQALGRDRDGVHAVARVAVNLRGVDPGRLPRGTALTTPGRFHHTDVADLRAVARLPARLTLHVGAAAVPVTTRRLGADVVRVRLARALPLRVGDRVLLRDPGRHDLLVGALVLDPAPPPLRRRGAARARAEALADAGGHPDARAETRRRGVVAAGLLERIGVDLGDTPVRHGWLVDDARWASAREGLVREVAAHLADDPLSGGLTVEAARARLELPDARLVMDLASESGLTVTTGRLRPAGSPGATLPDRLATAAETLRRELTATPFAAPEAIRLTELGLGERELAALERAGVVRRVGGVVLAPDALDRAVEVLRTLPAPFTASAARQALGTTRRVVIPLLEALDRSGRTRAGQDGQRTIR